VKADRIHGNDRSRSGRRRSPASRPAAPVLVATDIAARGIDVDALGHVVNFDVPLVPETTFTASAAPAAPNHRRGVHVRGARRAA
jgi:superfamily II DNA/RNA helicase